MAKKNGYIINGETEVGTLKEVTDIIGKRVSKKDIVEGLVPEVEYVEYEDDNEEIDTENLEDVDADEEGIDDVDEDEEDMDEDSEEDNEETEDIKDEEEPSDLDDGIEDDSEDDSEKTGEKPDMQELLAKLKANNEKIARENPEALEKSKKRKNKVELLMDEDGNTVYPEKGYFKSEDEIKKYYKQLDDDQLDEWLELEGLEYTANEHAGINRMRKCMAIKEYHFPKENKSKKSKSKYADFTTEELLQMALDNDVEVKDAKGNLKILRMYCIMALRDAKVLE